MSNLSMPLDNGVEAWTGLDKHSIFDEIAKPAKIALLLALLLALRAAAWQQACLTRSNPLARKGIQDLQLQYPPVPPANAAQVRWNLPLAHHKFAQVRCLVPPICHTGRSHRPVNR